MSDTTVFQVEAFLIAALDARLDERSREWLREHCAEIAGSKSVSVVCF